MEVRPLISQLSSEDIINFEFKEQSKSFILTLKSKIVPVCFLCHEEITGVPYFNRQSRRLFHKHCVMDNNMSKYHFQGQKTLDQIEFNPVIIKWTN